MENLGKAFYALIVLVVGVLASSYVLLKLWGWIITPTFGVEELTIAQAFGLSVVVGYLKFGKKVKDKSEEHDNFTSILSKALGRILLSSSLFLLIGWVASLFIS